HRHRGLRAQARRHPVRAVARWHALQPAPGCAPNGGDPDRLTAPTPSRPTRTTSFDCPEGMIASQAVRPVRPRPSDGDSPTDFNLCAPSANTRSRQLEASLVPPSPSTPTSHVTSLASDREGASNQAACRPSCRQKRNTTALTGGPLHTRLGGSLSL